VSDGHHGAGTGLKAGRDVILKGQYVAGRDLHLQIVRPAPVMPGPFQLPRDTADFTDRERAVEELTRLLRDGRDDNGSTVAVSAIAGTAGVGKTALATKVAHQLYDDFPDGQLYANLRGGDQERRQDPGLVLGEFLLGLGVARGSIPEDLEQRAARFRTQLAGHRILVVLDNAVDEAQVQPLLPGSPGCAALITSRVALTGLPGVRPYPLNVLGPEEGIELLAKIAGPERVEAEPGEARRIVRLCGHLPLAVRIAGGKLAARPHWTLRMLANRLSDDHNLLSELRLRDLEVRASFELSYRDLEQDERRAFRLLALLKAPDFTAWVASALLDRELVEAEELLARLVEAQVLEDTWDPGSGGVRYRFHDLLRAFARERLWSEEPPASQEAALERALDAHVVLAEYAASVLEPGGAYRLSDVWWLSTRSGEVAERVAADPGAWFSAERVNLVSAIEQASDQGVLDVVWRLARAVNYFFKLRNHWSDWEHTQVLGLAAAERAGHRLAQANALRSLGDVASQHRRFEEANERFADALDLFIALGDEQGEAWTRIGLANAHLDHGLFDQALAQFEHGLRHFDATGDGRGQAWSLLGSGIVHRLQGRRVDAKTGFQQALDLFVAASDRRGRAYCLVNLGILHRDRGQFDVALEWFDRARPIFRELVDHHGETFVLLNIGHMLREQGQYDQAVAALDVCLATFGEFGERGGETWTLLNLAMVWQGQGHHEQAIAQFHQCLARFHQVQDRRGEAWTLLGLGETYRILGRLGDAQAAFDRSLPLHQDLGDQLGRGKVLHAKALALEAVGDRPAAVVFGRESAQILRHLGAAEASAVEEWLQR
jgi:tetratricopeptide (TPR) repeat protein